MLGTIHGLMLMPRRGPLPSAVFSVEPFFSTEPVEVQSSFTWVLVSTQVAAGACLTGWVALAAKAEPESASA